MVGHFFNYPEIVYSSVYSSLLPGVYWLSVWLVALKFSPPPYEMGKVCAYEVKGMT